MGSEHSVHASQQQPPRRQSTVGGGSNRQANIRRQHTIANPGSFDTGEADNGRPGSTSPGPSVCGDVDLPYISYTVNRPIGGKTKTFYKSLGFDRFVAVLDSPKLVNKQAKPKVRKPQTKYGLSSKKSSHNIVVVKQASSGPNIDRDSDILRLQVCMRIGKIEVGLALSPSSNGKI